MQYRPVSQNRILSLKATTITRLSSSSSSFSNNMNNRYTKSHPKISATAVNLGCRINNSSMKSHRPKQPKTTVLSK